MGIIRPSEYANPILRSPWQRVQAQLEKLAPAYPQFQRDLEHQPFPQSCVRRERLRERHQALCIAPWTNGVTDGMDLCLFQGFNTIRCTSARSQRAERTSSIL